MAVLFGRGDYWQIGYVIPKGGYQKLKNAGVEALKEAVARLAPPVKEAVMQLRDWSEVSLLSVKSSRVPRWSREGLLLIGDAAHVMSPVGGVGINYAIQDAGKTGYQ
jgi:2-polyprenyl-6-methoxyphenol hydroxylase-like FAD-dependent oxidoreductase